MIKQNSWNISTTVFRRLIRELKPNPYLLVLALVILASTEVFPFLYPLLLRKVLDQSVHATSLIHDISLYIALVLGHSFLLYSKALIGTFLSAHTTHRLRLRLTKHVHTLPLPQFQKESVGNWMTRLGSDVDSLGAFFKEGILELVSNALLLLFAIVFMFWQEPRLATVTLIFFPIMVWVTNAYRHRFRSAQKNYRSRISDLTGFVQEAINGISLVQVFRKQRYLSDRFEAPHQEYTKAGIHWAKTYAGFFPAVQTLSDLSLIACYAGGLWWISNGQISPGTLASFAWIASIYTRPLRDLSDRFNQLQGSMAAGDRVLAVLDMPLSQPDGSILVEPLQSNRLPIIEFNKVHFAYAPQSPVLKGISFQVAKGTVTAIVGESGSGKSTILHLLNRLYQPTQGQILVNGHPLNTLQMDSYRNFAAYVGQDPFLFQGSIQENILLGAPADPVRLAEACRRARIDRIAESLPMGLDTQVGSQGIDVSRGQRQLIACARAFYRDPQLLVLDEPTASIDPWTETLLQEALQELMTHRTTILVSHRLSSIVHAHQILYLKEGLITQQGSHEELLKQGLDYGKMFEISH